MTEREKYLTNLLNESVSHLEESAQLIEDWGSYASEYFQKKHNLKGDVAMVNKWAADLKKNV